MKALAVRPTSRVSRVSLLVVVLVLMLGLPASAAGGPSRGEALRDSSTAHPHQLRGDLRHHHGVRQGDHPVQHGEHPVRVRSAAIV